jgi:thiamine-phosphate pyrophosphorylase
MNTGQRIRGLYVITPDALSSDVLIARVDEAIGGGARLVQYRRKGVSASEKLDEARRIAALCRDRSALFIVNDDPKLAAEVGADGVHLGRDDGTVAAARAVLGERAVVGVSCYDRLDMAVAGERCGADYVAFGSFFPSSVKPGAVRPPLQLLHEARAVLACPVVAIGGITLDRGAELVAAGADSLAVISDIFQAGDVSARSRAYARLFESADGPNRRTQTGDHELTQ